VTYYVTCGKKRNTERKADQSIPAGHCHVLVSITVTTNYVIQEEIKSRLKPENACYHSVQNLLSSSSISKNIKIKIYRTIILPVVLHWCETWSLILREGPRLRVFENRVLSRIFGPKKDEITRKWRKLYNEELNDLYLSPNIIWVIKSRIRWAGYGARMGGEERCIQRFGGKS
jgi:hypothetical protein